ncbi:MAG: hypothetical protein IT260_00480 [Saprospiraceae bacterium]|nr:hypothetical protein [Saprospiraceae bacterium]
MKKSLRLDKEARFYNIVQKGVALLQDTQSYTQRSVIHKLKMINHAVSASTLSNIVNGKKAGLQMLKMAANGIQKIIFQEMSMEYSWDAQEYIVKKHPNWKPYIIPEEVNSIASSDVGVEIYPDGRVSIQKKTEFISTAQKEVIEVGVRLKTFAGYFDSRKDTEYKDYILSLLKKGVTVKVCMLDPESNLAHLYFDDRAIVQASEKEALSESRKVVTRLKLLLQEMKEYRYPGSFEVYLYRHVPYNHFLVVDPSLEGGKMMISHYIFGVRRAECPVLEFTRSKQKNLFGKYLVSLMAYLKDARSLI